MTSDRFVLLGLARPRAQWFADLSRWSMSAAVAAEFVKCVSPEELRARLTSGRTWSAVLLDGAMPQVDRDLLAVVRDAGCPAIVVDGRDDLAHWRAIGAAAVLPPAFDRAALIDVLETVAVTVGRPMALPTRDATPATDNDGIVVAVCGPGGTGASIVAAALAQGLGATGRHTLLADLARHAEQAALHDVRDVVPGVQELVEAHRNGVTTAADVRAMTFSVVDRGYSLLLGLRRSRYWPALRPRAFEAAFESLRRSFDVVVCDVTADFEGEADAGSADVEERNLAARTAADHADVVVVVGRPGVKGTHSLVRVLADLVAADVPPARVLPVVNLAPRSPRSRAELTAAIVELAGPVLGGALLASPIYLPARPVDQALRDGHPLPSPLPSRAAESVLALLERTGPRSHRSREPQPVGVGAVGSFTEELG